MKCGPFGEKPFVVHTQCILLLCCWLHINWTLIAVSFGHENICVILLLHLFTVLNPQLKFSCTAIGNKTVLVLLKLALFFDKLQSCFGVILIIKH